MYFKFTQNKWDISRWQERTFSIKEIDNHTWLLEVGDRRLHKITKSRMEKEHVEIYPKIRVSEENGRAVNEMSLN